MNAPPPAGTMICGAPPPSSIKVPPPPATRSLGLMSAAAALVAVPGERARAWRPFHWKPGEVEDFRHRSRILGLRGKLRDQLRMTGAAPRTLPVPVSRDTLYRTLSTPPCRVGHSLLRPRNRSEGLQAPVR